MSLHTVDASQASAVPVLQQAHAFLSPVWKVSYTTAAGWRECRLVVSANHHAVMRAAKRVLGAEGCTDFVVGRYLGAEHPEPAPSRAKEASCPA